MVSNFKNLRPYNAAQSLAWIKSSRILTVLIMTLSIMCFSFTSYASEELDLVKLKRSAEAGVPKSQLELALIYSEGRNGVRKNTEAAVAVITAFKVRFMIRQESRAVFHGLVDNRGGFAPDPNKDDQYTSQLQGCLGTGPCASDECSLH